MLCAQRIGIDDDVDPARWPSLTVFMLYVSPREYRERFGRG
jgi:hypothetical protein